MQTVQWLNNILEVYLNKILDVFIDNLETPTNIQINKYILKKERYFEEGT